MTNLLKEVRGKRANDWIQGGDAPPGLALNLKLWKRGRTLHRRRRGIGSSEPDRPIRTHAFPDPAPYILHVRPLAKASSLATGN
jgi:hypothetical protein